MVNDKKLLESHPLKNYGTLINNYAGWIVPLGLSLGFGYHHSVQEDGEAGCAILQQKSDFVDDQAKYPTIQIIGHLDDPQVRYKFAAVATSLLIHKELKNDTFFNHLTDIDEMTPDDFGPIIWWASHISKLPIAGRSTFTQSIYQTTKELVERHGTGILPELRETFPNEHWKVDISPYPIALPNILKAPHLDNWENAVFEDKTQGALFNAKIQQILLGNFDPVLVSATFSRQAFLAANSLGMSVKSLPRHHKPIGFYSNEPGMDSTLTHGGDQEFEIMYIVLIIGLGLHLMQMSKEFKGVDFRNFQILHTDAINAQLNTATSLNHHQLLLGHAIHWATYFVGKQAPLHLWLPKSSKKIWTLFKRNGHDKYKWWEH